MVKLEGQVHGKPSKFGQFRKKWKRLQRELRHGTDPEQLLSLAEQLYVFLEEWEWEVHFENVLADSPGELNSITSYVVN
ncbi:MAG TPA: hypothetical protein VFA90_17660 [Terriglobales bacterium]|nr:hypothetical protein [Terriglobales bacterium]